MNYRLAAAGAMLCTCVAAVGVACGGVDVTTSSSSTTTLSSTTTTTEAPATWREVVSTGEGPSARCYHGAVFAVESGAALIFGGFDGVDLLQDGWSFDPARESWTALEIDEKGSPLANKQIAAAYVPEKGVVVSFDGTSWGYEVGGSSWEKLNPKGRKLKPAREGSCLALDEASGKLVLFGGTDNTRAYNETWVYDPDANQWAEIVPVGDVPSGRSDAGMAYDPGSGLMVLFGGVDSEFTCLNDTWTFDLDTVTWERVSPMTRVPLPRSAHAMAFDGHSGGIILYGGVDSSFVCHDDIWVYDVEEEAWVELMPAGAVPAARCRTQLVYAPGSDVLVLFGGMTFGVDQAGSFGIPSYYDDTWVFGVEP